MPSAVSGEGSAIVNTATWTAASPPGPPAPPAAGSGAVSVATAGAVIERHK
jgi:hypothetical protein